MKDTYSKYLAPMAIGGALGSLFGNQAPDYSNVESQLQQIPGTITPYFQPYIQAGEQSLGGLQQQLRRWISHKPRNATIDDAGNRSR
jgi:hypothetical protein